MTTPNIIIFNHTLIDSHLLLSSPAIISRENRESAESSFKRGYWEKRMRSYFGRSGRVDPDDDPAWIKATLTNIKSKCKPGDMLEFHRGWWYRHWVCV